VRQLGSLQVRELGDDARFGYLHRRRRRRRLAAAAAAEEEEKKKPSSLLLSWLVLQSSSRSMVGMTIIGPIS
jgi:hypothetical protein